MIEIQTEGDIAILRMAHGPANAIDAEFMQDLVKALDEVEAGSARAVVLTGRDAAFSAGADLFRIIEEGAEYLAHAGPIASQGFERLFAFPRPVVAAVNGHAIAGGCVLALACDHRVAASGDYRIGLPELKVGVPFPAPALEIVRFAVAPPYLQRLVFGAQLLSPDDALAWGLVDEVVEPQSLLERAETFARRLARIPATTFEHTKLGLRENALANLRRTGAERDAEGQVIWGSDAARASIRAFLKRTFGTDMR